MSKFVKTLSLFLAGLPLVTSKSAYANISLAGAKTLEGQEPVSLRPLNLPHDNLYAGHSSHSSHASHSSHYSGSGGDGGYDYRDSTTPSYSSPSPPPVKPVEPAASAPKTGSQRRTSSSFSNGASQPVLTAEEKKKLQVMRVQIQLNLLGLYSGPMDGIFSKETRDSLMQFQAVKSLPASGMMTTDTLNVLGVPAVN